MRDWRHALADYMRQAEKPQTAYEITRGFNSTRGSNRLYSEKMSDGSIRSWLRYGVLFGVLDCDYSSREYRYAWRRDTNAEVLAALGSIESSVSALRQSIDRRIRTNR